MFDTAQRRLNTLSFHKALRGRGYFYLNFCFFLIHHYHFQRTLCFVEVLWMAEEIGREGEKKPPRTNSWCVCLGLIMGSVDDIQHKAGALISGMSHSFFSLCYGACIHCYWAHDWLSLMAICHANDGVPNRFGANAPPFNVRTRGTQAFCWELAVALCCVSHKPGSSPRVTLIPHPSRPSAHQQSRAYCGDLATTVLLPRWLQ